MRTGTSVSVSATDHLRFEAIVVWRADPDDIIAARTRGFQSLESIH